MGIRIFDAEGMRAADREAIEDRGIPSLLLMENAGRGVVEGLQRCLPRWFHERYLIACGRGNNGGDGLVVARHLLDRGVEHVYPVLFGDPDRMSNDARWNLERLKERGIEVPVVRSMEEWRFLYDRLPEPTVIVDALFGTGLSRPLEGFVAEWVQWVNRRHHLIRVAVDVPSGLFADTGELPGPAFHAHYTFTMAGLKHCLVFPPACELAGQWYVISIGTPPDVLQRHSSFVWPERVELRRWLGRRLLDTHKGNYGRIVIIGGAPGRLGAPWMAGMAALRSGAGLVTVAVPRSCWSSLMAMSRELMTLGVPEEDGVWCEAALSFLEPELEKTDVVVLGPGIGTAPATAKFIRAFLEMWRGFLVVDADGLNILAKHPEWLDVCPAEAVFTPHPGEMARLTGLTVKEVLERRVALARQYAEDKDVILVLKGYRTLIAHPNGEMVVNPTGNPGMATAGMGDILSGFIGGLMGQLRDAWRAAVLGVYLHGLTGDLVAKQRGQEALMATDLLDRVGDALRELEQDDVRRL